MLTAGHYIFVFIFGAIIGSFLNVVSLRMNTGRGLGGRSMCMSCAKKLSWYELVPILSYVLQRGACRGCRSRISAQYALVECLTGAIFALIVWQYPPLDPLAALETALYLLATCIVMVIAIYDIRHQIIPDRLAIAFAAIALAIHPTVEAALSGIALAAPFALLWLVSRGRWIGLGDAKLAVGIGILTGLSAGINAVILAFWIGAAVSILWMLSVHGRYARGMAIPLGPYLILGMYIILLTPLRVLDVSTLLEIFRV